MHPKTLLSAGITGFCLLNFSCTQPPQQVDLSPLLTKETNMVDGSTMLLSEYFGPRGALFVSMDPFCEPLPEPATTLRTVLENLPTGYSLALYYPGRTVDDLSAFSGSEIDQLGLAQLVDGDCSLANTLVVRKAHTASLISVAGVELFKGPISVDRKDGLMEALEKNAEQDIPMGTMPEVGCALKCDFPSTN